MRSLSSSRLLKSPSGSKPLSTTMVTKDTTLQSDISKRKKESDGSFKQADASFRNTIAKGSQFEPEIGGFQRFISDFFWPKYFLCLLRPLSPLCFLCLSYVLHSWDHGFVSFDMFVTAWATRALIVRKLKGLESIIRRQSILVS